MNKSSDKNKKSKLKKLNAQELENIVGGPIQRRIGRPPDPPPPPPPGWMRYWGY